MQEYISHKLAICTSIHSLGNQTCDIVLLLLLNHAENGWISHDEDLSVALEVLSCEPLCLSFLVHSDIDKGLISWQCTGWVLYCKHG